MLHITALLRSNFSSLFLFLAVIVCCAVTARAQSALDGFDPNANGAIRVVVVQADGKVLIGGDFTTLSSNGGAPVARNQIARLNPDGTIDTAFDPNANATVFSIAVQADGKVLVGGNFNNIGGQPRNFIARLDALTGLADSFDPNANGSVQSIAVQADGKVLVGGFFNGANSIGGATRNRVARLDATTGLADALDPNANGIVYSIAVQADGKILVGGLFTNIAGQTRNRIARLDPISGAVDSFDPNANGNVFSIAVQPDGKILAGGSFSGANSIGGQTRNRIARLDPTTGLADSFNPNANGIVQTIAVQPDGKILAGGVFLIIGGQTRNRIARLDATSGLADSLNPNVNAGVHAIAVQPDGKILAVGDFSTIGGQTRNSIARLETDGRLDRTLDLGVVGSDVFATAVQPDGKILIGGTFSTGLGGTRNNIARLNTDGTLDTAFNPNANNAVFSIAVQADGKVLVGGRFTNIGGQTRNRIARLDAVTGAADLSFDPNANGGVNSIVVQADGKIIGGGFFTSIGGQPRNNIARLDTTTGLADSFDPSANSDVYSIAVQADGKILTGGFFTSIGGQPRNRIARLDSATGLADSFDPSASHDIYSIAVQADGNILVGGIFTNIGGQMRNRIARLDAATGLPDSFDPSANSDVYSIAVQADGKIIVGGFFTSIGGQTRNRLARLDAASGLADSFDPNANGAVYSMAVQADGKILAGGDFTTIGGQARNVFARLSNDTAALQNLAVTQTSVTWTRSGSSPLFSRVTFEDSTDGVNYNFLGSGTPSGGNWTLTCLNLSTGQNIYIRARGYYRGGYQNGSESIQESVRNVFIPGPTISGTITYRNAIGAPTPRFVSNVLLSGAGSPTVMTTTAAPGPCAGTYSLNGFGAGPYTVTPTKTGGVNGAISSFDAGRIALHVAGPPNPQLTATQLIVADVSNNGAVSSFDAGMIAKFVAGPPYSAPGIGQTATWRFMPVKRNYASVTGNVTGEDFIALLMGEVSGNWTNTGARPADARRQLAKGSGPERGVAVEFPQIEAAVDKEIIVPINVEGIANKGIISYEFDLRYDQSVIQPLPSPVDVAGTASRGLLVVTNASEPGLLRVVVYGPMPIDSDGVLLNLRFTAVGEPGTVSPLTWERIMFNEGEPEVSAVDGLVELSTW